VHCRNSRGHVSHRIREQSTQHHKASINLCVRFPFYIIVSIVYGVALGVPVAISVLVVFIPFAIRIRVCIRISMAHAKQVVEFNSIRPDHRRTVEQRRLEWPNARGIRV